MNGKILAIAVVAVMVVAGVGIGIYALANNKGTSDSTVKGMAVDIYGNANNDYYINDDDINLIKDIISKNSDSDDSNNIDWEKDYPFADANHDSKVNDDDATFVQTIMGANAENKVKVYIRNYNKETPYVDTVTIPLTAVLANTNQTSMIAFKTLGIDDQIKGTSYYYASGGAGKAGDVNKAQYDKYIFNDYFDAMVESKRISYSTAKMDDDLKKSVTDLGCSAFYLSSSNGTVANYDKIKNTLKYDVVQLRDGSGNIEDYNSAVLTLGYIFGEETHNKAIEYVKWMNEFGKDLQKHLEKLSDSDKKKGAASSGTTSVSVNGSSNVSIVTEAGMDCPIGKKASTTGETTQTYDKSKGDTWLNFVDLDTLVVLKGSTKSTKDAVDYNWSWFDKDYSSANIPASFKTHMSNFSNLSCYNDSVVLSTMLPGPLKSGALANYFYPDIFPENWIQDKAGEFLQKFWGFTEEQTQGQQYVLSKQVIMGS